MKRKFETDKVISNKLQKKSIPVRLVDGEDHIRIIKSDEMEIKAPKFEFDATYLDEFKKLAGDDKGCDTSVKNNLTATLLKQIKGRWIVDSVLKKFVEKWEEDKTHSCYWWRQIFRRSLNPFIEVKYDLVENEGGRPSEDMDKKFEGIPFIDDVDDLGQLAVMIGMYCYGYPGGTAWDHYCYVLTKLCGVDEQSAWEPIKFCIDFFHAALHPDSGFLSFVRSGDNARFHYASDMLLNRVFFKKDEFGYLGRFDRSCIEYVCFY